METNKIIRGVCYFSDTPSQEVISSLNAIEQTLTSSDFMVQTKRICVPTQDILELEKKISDHSIYLSVGSLSLEFATLQLHNFLDSRNTSFNIDLTDQEINSKAVEILFEIIRKNASKTFLFTYVFRNMPSTPFFPSAHYEKNGFSIGLQPTDLSEDCTSLEQWFGKMKTVWEEVYSLMGNNSEFLGIDSSIAPLFGKGSLLGFINRLGYTFSHSATTDIYLQITDFIKKNNPQQVGLCGLMFPCLEDDVLSKEYEKGNFSIERNIYLSLHSGLGVDTYPVGIDEKPERVLEILCLIQKLSAKYNKPLSCRLVSDGKARIGEKTDFQNEFLKDVIIRPL